MKISKELYDFFKAYKKWVSSGAKKNKIFVRSKGLCYNLVRYLYNKDLSFIVKCELRELLEDQFGNSEYPFGELSYEARKSEGTQHLCPERMSFVDKCIEAYESSTLKEEKVVKSKSKSSLKIGDKVKGVKFSSEDYPLLGWNDEMDKYVGRVGKVISHSFSPGGFRVCFGGDSWSYPAHLLKRVDEGGADKQQVKGVAPKDVWGVVDMETGNVISIEITREKARQMKARLNGDFKIAKMTFDKWVR